ncbi:hypothetical protein FGO68_gene17683 [Halteria grandinella]|uniref:Uncharacterized protein n=1 Tax=Halteria grandinella TaxID=5974 RepID=A0A8J8NK86_HALGN|nr:hypothetical protein FGO68_gene17683 [Halteria grandinella]
MMVREEQVHKCAVLLDQLPRESMRQSEAFHQASRSIICSKTTWKRQQRIQISYGATEGLRTRASLLLQQTRS